jgi:hypothetical protein
MTIDEAIQHCKDVARDNRAKAEEEWRAFSIYPFGNVEESATFVDRCDECAEQHEQLAQWLEELKEYEQLEEQGLLLKLPCKVGDIIYEIVNDEIISFSFQQQWRIARYLEAGIFGKIAFLTKEEAEKALLKRLEGAE